MTIPEEGSTMHSHRHLLHAVIVQELFFANDIPTPIRFGGIGVVLLSDTNGIFKA